MSSCSTSQWTRIRFLALSGAALLCAAYATPAQALCGGSATQNQSTTHDDPWYPAAPPPCACIHTIISHQDDASCPGAWSGGSGGGDAWLNGDGTYTTYWQKNSGNPACGSYEIRSSFNCGSCAVAAGAALTVHYPSSCAPACDPNAGNSCHRENACGMRNYGTVECDGSCKSGGQVVQAPPNSSCPVGSHDASSCTSVWGWGFDPEYAGAMQVHVYDGLAGGGGTFLTALTANQSRPDVGAVYPGRTNSGWSFDPRSFPTLMNGAPHSLNVYAINVDGSGGSQIPNPFLAGTPKSLTCTDPPTGTLTAACGSVSGTATDNQGSPVSVSIREQTGAAPSCAVDPLLAGPVNAVPAFNASIPTFTDGKVHTVTACATDVGSGQTPVQPFATTQISCPPVISLTSGAASVDFGASTTITWSVTNASSSADCTAAPAGWFNPASIVNGTGGGSASTGPLTVDTTYTLTCRNKAGTSGGGSRTVTVIIPPPEASIVSATIPPEGYCAGEPVMDITWGYSSVARRIGAYQVQVLRGGSVIYDSTKITTARSPTDNSVASEHADDTSLWSRTSSRLASAFTSLFTR